MNQERTSPNNKGFESWFTLIKQSRRKYAYSRLKELDGSTFVFLKKMIKWTYKDAMYVLHQGKAIFFELQDYGSSIRDCFGVSRFRQFFQQAYLAFILCVPVKFYRFSFLFDPERWRLVKQFTHENYPVQMILVDQSFPEEKALFDNKLHFYKRCTAAGITSPTPIAVFENGNEIFNSSEVLQLPPEPLFVKDLCGRRGQGIEKYDVRDGKYLHKSAPLLEATELIDLLKKRSLSNDGILVQQALKNHPVWQKYTSGALASCRVLTARSPDDNSIITLAATMRMPVGSSDADNLSTGGIACPVNLENGILGTGICFIPQRGQYQFVSHPDTGQNFTQTILPKWDEMISFAEQAHRAFNTFFVGWDIALTSKGFTLIEGNIGWAASAIETPQLRPLLHTQFPSLFDKWLRRSSILNQKKERKAGL